MRINHHRCLRCEVTPTFKTSLVVTSDVTKDFLLRIKYRTRRYSITFVVVRITTNNAFIFKTCPNYFFSLFSIARFFYRVPSKLFNRYISNMIAATNRFISRIYEISTFLTRRTEQKERKKKKKQIKEKSKKV